MRKDHDKVAYPIRHRYDILKIELIEQKKTKLAIKDNIKLIMFCFFKFLIIKEIY